MGQAVIIGITIAAAVASAYGQRQAALARQAVARRNQALATMAADRARAKGKADETTARMRQSAFIGKQRALMAARGAVVDQDSPLRLIEDSAMFGELDAKAIENYTESAAAGYEAQADMFGFQADVAQQNSFLIPAVTLVGGAASAAGMSHSLSGGGQVGTLAESGGTPSIVGEGNFGWETSNGTILV